ncbi:MAG: hypothetical protein U0K87_07180 [Ruminococcus sp.]|nr:hypothetical protein [Ruminococcus sp.]
MIINSNAKFNTAYAEFSVIGFGSIAVPFCACCMCCVVNTGGS